MRQAGQRDAGVCQAALVDDGPQEPGEGGLLAVPGDLRHAAPARAARPDPRPVVEQEAGQLHRVVEVGSTEREQAAARRVDTIDITVRAGEEETGELEHQAVLAALQQPAQRHQRRAAQGVSLV